MCTVIDLEKEKDLDIKPQKKFIGQGSYGVVTLNEWNNRDVAVKRFIGDDLKSFMSELKNLTKVCHENIIQCLAYHELDNLIIMEYAEDGSLHQLLHTSRYSNVHYNLAHSLGWALQCARGVQYLHNYKPKLIIHRDLKPLNILLMNNFSKIKICDFGTACENKTVMTQTTGSVSWMAPEVMTGRRYNEKCDIFSWGIILWEIFSRKLPYSTEQSNEVKNDDSNKSTNCTTQALNPYAIMWSIVSNGSRPKLLKNCPEVIEDLIKSCWEDDPEKRPTMDEIVNRMETYFNIVKDRFDPIDSSSIVPEEMQKSYLYFSSDSGSEAKMMDNGSLVQKCTVTLKKNIPDNVNLEPRSELVIGNKHFINFSPIMNDDDSNKTFVNIEESEALKVVNVEKLPDDRITFESVMGSNASNTSNTSNRSSNIEYKYNDDDNDLAQGCGMPTYSTLSKLVNGLLYEKQPSQSTFYIEDTNFPDAAIGELEKNFSTLATSVDKSDKGPNNDSRERIQINITKHTAKNHRSEIEINNSNKMHQLNSSASSTVSSSTSLVVNNDKKANELTNLDRQKFRSNDDVDNFFSHSTNEDDSNPENSDDYKLGSSFESIDKEQIEEQIEKEYPNGQSIKYKYNGKKKKSVMKQFKKILSNSSHKNTVKDLIRLPEV